MPTLQRTGKEITEIYNRQVDTVYRICYSFMKNPTETEDLVQETFLRLMASNVIFQSQEHEKAWLIVTASNLCKDSLKKWWRKQEPLEEYEKTLRQPPFEVNEVLDAVMKLPADQKTAVYMYYYEGYTTSEISAYLKCPQATVRSRLARARKVLKQKLGGDF